VTDREVSIVVVAREPSLTLARLLRSLARADGIERAELLLALNGDDGVEAARRLVRRRLPEVPLTVLSLPATTVPDAKNALVRRATAPVLLFLDDDVEVRPDVLVQARSALEDPRVVAAGGPNLTPPESPPLERLAGRVLGSALGSGFVHDRYRVARAQPGHERTLQGCNLAVRRAAIGEPPFDAALLCAEENELLARLEREGGALVYRPELAVFHHRRATLRGHLAQMVKYGVGRGSLFVRAPSLRQLPYLVPTLALAALACAAPFVAAPVLAVLAAYAVVVTVGALRLAPRGPHLALALIVLTHGGYALGVAAGAAVELWPRAGRAPAAEPVSAPDAVP
jgi:hypothetical protein